MRQMVEIPKCLYRYSISVAKENEWRKTRQLAKWNIIDNKKKGNCVYLPEGILHFSFLPLHSINKYTKLRNKCILLRLCHLMLLSILFLCHSSSPSPSPFNLQFCKSVLILPFNLYNCHWKYHFPMRFNKIPGWLSHWMLLPGHFFTLPHLTFTSLAFSL